MAEHVGKARSCLERWQRERELRIHERELRTLGVVRVARFHLQCVVRHHRVLRRLAAGSRDGEHHGDGQHVVRQPLRLEEIPHVPVVVRAHGDGLRRVDDRAAAHGQHPVDIVFLAQRDAFASKRDLGVRTHAAQLHVLDALSIRPLFTALWPPKCSSTVRAPRSASLLPTCSSAPFPNTKWVGDTNSKFSIDVPFRHAFTSC